MIENNIFTVSLSRIIAEYANNMQDIIRDTAKEEDMTSKELARDAAIAFQNIHQLSSPRQAASKLREMFQDGLTPTLLPGSIFTPMDKLVVVQKNAGKLANFVLIISDGDQQILALTASEVCW